jgi:hypothetical protein
MTRRTVAVDRVLVLLAGLLLIAIGVAAVLWRQRLLPGAKARLVLASGVADAPAQSWWAGALAVAGLLLVGLALWWLLSHLKRSRPTRLGLSGSSAQGRLSYDVGAVADAAARSLGSQPDVTSVRSATAYAGGRPIVDLKATTSARADVAGIERAVAGVAHQLTAATDGTVRLRVRVDVRRRAPAPRRVT